MRRTIIIVGIIILLALLGIGLYFLFFAGKPASTTGTTGTTGTLPSAGNQSGGFGTTGNSNASSTSAPTIGQDFGVVANGPVLAYYVNSANVATIVNTDGTITQITSGQSSTLSELGIQNILSASFSYDGAKILVNFGNPGNPQSSVFDIASKAWSSLPVGMQSPVWSPSDYRIAYATANADGTETFSTIDASKAKPTPVAIDTLHVQALGVAWPAKTTLALYTKPSAYNAGSTLTLNIQTGAITTIASEEDGLDILWNSTAMNTTSSPASLIFSSGESNLGGSLQLANSLGSSLENLTFLTLPSKCAFAAPTSTITQPSSTVALTTSTPYLFCGVPTDQDQFSIAHLPDDYDQMALFTTDNLYRINLQTGEIDTVLNGNANSIDASDVKFFNNTLFFVNRYDQKLYGVELN